MLEDKGERKRLKKEQEKRGSEVAGRKRRKKKEARTTRTEKAGKRRKRQQKLIETKRGIDENYELISKRKKKMDTK